MSSQQMIVTMTVEDLSSIVEDASLRGALRALQEVEQKKQQSNLLEKEFLTFKEVGDLFSISRATVVRWIEEKKIVRVYVNAAPRFPVKNLKKLINN